MSIQTERLHDIWSLTWPQAMMLLCQFVIGITDVWTGGRIGPEVQASIGLITQVQMLFMALAIAATSGAVAAISQSFGAGRPVRARRYVGLVVVGSIVLGAGLAATGTALRVPFLHMVQTPEHMMPVASLFFAAYIWSLPGQYTLSIGAAVFRAARSVLMPLYVTSGVCVVNIFGDLAFGLGWWGFPSYGAAGVAWATFVSVSLGAVFILLLLVREKLLTRQSLPGWRWIKQGAPYLLKVAGPALGTSALWQSGYLVLFAITAALPHGSIAALAGLTAGMRIEAFLFLPAVAFNMTASVLVGHALGAGNRAEAKRVMLSILAIACGGMSLIGACLWPWRVVLAGLLAPDPAVQLETTSYLTYNILSAPFTVASVVLAGALTGAGATIYPLVAFSTAVWLVRLPVAWFLGHELWQDASGVFVSMLVSQMVQSSMLLWVALRCDWARFAMIPKPVHCPKTGAPTDPAEATSGTGTRSNSKAKS